MKIEIDYNGAFATCKVNGKHLYECDNLTKARVFSAFNCIKQNFDRDNKIMTREYEIRKEAEKYTLCIFGELDDFREVTDGFIDGAKWADENPQMYKGQTEQMEEREIAFMDWWLKEHQGERPTFADAIAWADETMIKKACEWLDDCAVVDIEEFRKAMEE